jgi:NAD(P)H-dependent FMN reductase
MESEAETRVESEAETPVESEAETPVEILAISGSLKSTSTNSALLRAAAGLAPAGMRFTFFDQQIGELPHFRPDLDEEGMSAPEAVAGFRRLVASADGILISCPEYAHGVPGSFKNALDWIVSSGELSRKPVALLMASPSGAAQAWAALTPTLLVLEADLVFESSLAFARRHLAEDGRLQDAGLEAEVRKALDALDGAVRRAQAASPSPRSGIEK